jgi:hypothetical protein
MDVSTVFDLNSDSLANLQKHQPSYQVVIFCHSNPDLVKLCNRGNFWRNMLRYHYPDIEAKDARRAYLENTPILFVINYNGYDIRWMKDNLGHQIPIYEEFESDAYLIPEAKINQEDWIQLYIKGSEFMRNNVWVGILTKFRSEEAKAYATKKDAILEFVEGLDGMFFYDLLEYAFTDTEEDLVTRQYSWDEPQENYENAFNIYSDPVGIETDEGTMIEVQLIPQDVMDRLYKMGYPQFHDGDTLEEVRQILYDYIDQNGFFCWGVDFTKGEKIDNTDVKTFYVFEVNLIKHSPDWY